MPQVKGSEIREKRQRLGVKPGEMADRVGISTPHLRNIELGNRTPAIEVVHRLARELGVEADDLLATPAQSAA